MVIVRLENSPFSEGNDFEIEAFGFEIITAVDEVISEKIKYCQKIEPKESYIPDEASSEKVDEDCQIIEPNESHIPDEVSSEDIDEVCQITEPEESDIPDEVSSDDIDEVCQITEPEESHIPDEVRSNFFEEHYYCFSFFMNIVFILLVSGCLIFVIAMIGKIHPKEAEKKQLNGQEIFSLIATLDDKEWVHHAMVHLWATEYGIEEAQKKSSKFLQSQLKFTNVWAALSLADFTSDKDLRKATVSFLTQNADKTVLDKVWIKWVLSNILRSIRKLKTGSN